MNNQNINLDYLLSVARDYEMSPDEMEAQRRSFAYGNIAIENPDITRALIDKIADEIKNGKIKKI